MRELASAMASMNFSGIQLHALNPETNEVQILDFPIDQTITGGNQGMDKKEWTFFMKVKLPKNTNHLLPKKVDIRRLIDPTDTQDESYRVICNKDDSDLFVWKDSKESNLWLSFTIRQSYFEPLLTNLINHHEQREREFEEYRLVDIYKTIWFIERNEESKSFIEDKKHILNATRDNLNIRIDYTGSVNPYSDVYNELDWSINLRTHLGVCPLHNYDKDIHVYADGDPSYCKNHHNLCTQEWCVFDKEGHCINPNHTDASMHTAPNYLVATKIVDTLTEEPLVVYIPKELSNFYTEENCDVFCKRSTFDIGGSNTYSEGWLHKPLVICAVLNNSNYKIQHINLNDSNEIDTEPWEYPVRALVSVMNPEL